MIIVQDKKCVFEVGSVRSVKGIGIVCGIATIPNPIIGRSIILKIVESTIDKNTYPFTHFCCFENQLSDFVLNKECNQQGFVDFFKNDGVLANPYENGSDTLIIESHSWNLGWARAKDHLEKDTDYFAGKAAMRGF